jgi:hypothetical protein
LKESERARSTHGLEGTERRTCQDRRKGAGEGYSLPGEREGGGKSRQKNGAAKEEHPQSGNTEGGTSHDNDRRQARYTHTLPVDDAERGRVRIL